VDHSHGTKIFEFDNDFRSSIDTYVPVTEHGKLFRISDASFRAKPTIELLYITGFKSLDAGPDDNHFLFLRRVLCVKVPSDIPVSKTPLLTYIHEEEAQSLNATNEMEVDTNSPLDVQHEQFQAGNDEAKEAQDESTTPPPSAINPMEAEMEPPPEEVQGDSHVATSREGTSNMPLPLQNNDNFLPINESPTLNATNAMEIDTNPMEAVTEPASDDVQEATSSCESCDNVIYDASSQKYFTARFNNNLKRYLNKTEVADLSTVDPLLLEDAKNQPNVWVSLPLGDAYDEPAPPHLITKVKCLYEQLEQPYCVTYCMANALFYCGFDLEARDLAAQAPLLAHLNMAAQLESMKGFLPNLVPLIGGVTIHGKRCANNKKKRSFTWSDLLSNITPYPTLVVPTKLGNGRMTHAFCVVDDLIFDSCTPYALKLKMESVNWIFNHKPVDIFMALRFDQKVSPKGNRVRGKYKRQVQHNWNRDEETQSHINSRKTTHKKLPVNKVYDMEYAVVPYLTWEDYMP
jgi:hypothetical protein